MTGAPPRGALQGQVAIVVGSGGLGAAIARAFAAAGATVVVADRDGEAAREAAASAEHAGAAPAASCGVDIADEESVSTMVEYVLIRHGTIDLLVNAAGITHLSPAEEFPAEAFDEVLAVNLRGTFLTCREVGRHMLERGRGAVVNISSVGGSAALTESVAYCASKGAVDQLTRTLAVEWADRGVRVNAIAPSWIRTPILDALEGRDDLLFERVRRVPLGRLGEPEEVAAVALFLASPAASLVTGAIVPADGGFLAR